MTAVAPLSPWPAVGDTVTIGEGRYVITRATIDDVELEAVQSRLTPRGDRRRVVFHIHPAALTFDRMRGEWR